VCNPSIQEVYKRKHSTISGSKKNTNIYKVRGLKKSVDRDHSKRDLRKQSCISELVFSQSSKFHAIPSFRMHHIKQKGITLQTTLRFFRLNLLFQHAKSSTTCLGITNSTPNILKAKFHKSLATSQ
jgi:hypothetical protein